MLRIVFLASFSLILVLLLSLNTGKTELNFLSALFLSFITATACALFAWPFVYIFKLTGPKYIIPYFKKHFLIPASSDEENKYQQTIYRLAANPEIRERISVQSTLNELRSRGLIEDGHMNPMRKKYLIKAIKTAPRDIIIILLVFLVVISIPDNGEYQKMLKNPFFLSFLGVTTALHAIFGFLSARKRKFLKEREFYLYNLGEKTEGTIMDVAESPMSFRVTEYLQRHRNRGFFQKFLRIFYTFKDARGKSHRAFLYTLSPSLPHLRFTPCLTQEEYDAFQPEKTITVLYDPLDPRISTILVMSGKDEYCVTC